MKLTLNRQGNSCCSANYFFTTDEPLNMEKLSRIFSLNESYKIRGHIFIDTKEYLIYGIVGSNQLKISMKNKVSDVNSLVKQFEAI